MTATAQQVHPKRSAFALVFSTFVFIAVQFGAAGTLRWTAGWIFMALLTGATFLTRIIMARVSPDTLLERARFGSVDGVQQGDRALVLIIGLLGPLATTLVAGLDFRFGWSTPLPVSARVGAALLVLAGVTFAGWAMISNPFFSAVARIQTDRGQHVISSGPYRIVRHPAYAGSILAWLAAPVLLGTATAFGPAAFMGAVIAFRTAREDRMLREQLPGYDVFARNTRARLLPGVW